MVERDKSRKTRKPRWKWVLFRLLAIGIGLLPLLVFELIARGAGWGIINEQTDPFVGFDSVQPLFVANSETECMEVDQRRYPYFRPESFSIKKPANEFRIFCLGGSTVQGRPYAIETSFTTWLEIALNVADRSKQWNAINCGGVSYASYRLAPILDEILQYEPDLIILYTGHNEFLEDRTYSKIKQVPQWQKNVHRKLGALRTYRMLRYWLATKNKKSVDTAKSSLPTEVDARLDYENGLADYHRDEIWKQGVIAHFDHNLRRMVQSARQAGIPVLLVNPVVNLVDQPPFKSEHRSDITEASKKLFAEHFKTGRQSPDVNTSLDALRKAEQIDPEYAAVHYAMGQAYLTLGNTLKAQAALIKSKETDICPLRIVEPMRQSIFQIARETGCPVVDLQQYFDQRSKTKIAGRQFLVDHVHPSIAAHQKIADVILSELVAQKIADIDLSAEATWQKQRVAAFRKHLGSLDALYFETGKFRLEGLIRWTQGKSKKQRE